ncbi:PQQ-binding-like beta-propeller repeat protein [Streptomyces sp.]|uniref:outer membrane protein assembly factor BamB family protein n=1 Tax=Streptomyces sp. TaxID=1931 RepID=UPI002F426D99
MSQPPPPPGNPPQFGKSDGAVPPPPPQGPPQAAPQAPPGGYGYPAPGAPPAENPYAAPVPPAQNPYASAPTQPAFPQAQFPGAQQVQTAPPPPGHGYPGRQQGYGPQQYGQPAPPPQTPFGYGPQMPPPGPYGNQPPYRGAPGGRSNSKLLVIVAAVVAAVLVIGGGVFLTTRGGGDPEPEPQATSGGPSGGTDTAKPHDSALSFGWDKAADAVAEKDNLKDALGIWFTGTYVVKNQIDKVVAYDAATGTQAWTIPAPGRGDCTAARDTYNNLTAIQYGVNCEKIMAIDLAAGQPKWTATLPGAGGASADFDYTEMAVSGDTVGVDWLEGSIAYRLSDQKVLWRAGDGDCEDDGYAGGKQFVAVVNCDYKTYKVQVIDPARNGAPKWSWPAPVGTEVNAIVSTDPVVVLLGTQGETFTDVATIVNGRLQSRVSLGTDKYDIDDDGTEKQAVHNVLVSNDSLYLTLRGKSDGNGNVLSGIVAFNLSDGRQKWVAKPGSKQEISGLDFQDGKVLAYEPPDYEARGRLVTLDPATGAISPYATFSEDAYDRLDDAAMHSYPVWHDGRFYMVTKRIYASSSDQKYLVTFG